MKILKMLFHYESSSLPSEVGVIYPIPSHPKFKFDQKFKIHHCLNYLKLVILHHLPFDEMTSWFETIIADFSKLPSDTVHILNEVRESDLVRISLNNSYYTNYFIK